MLSHNDAPSFSEFRKKVMSAVSAEGSEIFDVKKVIAVPVMNSSSGNFQGVPTLQVSVIIIYSLAQLIRLAGISKAHCVRIAADSKTNNVAVHYKVNYIAIL